MTSNKWYVTSSMWEMGCDMGSVKLFKWQLTSDNWQSYIWQLKTGISHGMCDMWQLPSYKR